MCVPLHACRGQSRVSYVFFCHSLPYTSVTGSLTQLEGSARLTESQYALRVYLFLSPVPGFKAGEAMSGFVPECLTLSLGPYA